MRHARLRGSLAEYYRPQPGQNQTSSEGGGGPTLSSDEQSKYGLVR